MRWVARAARRSDDPGLTTLDCGGSSPGAPATGRSGRRSRLRSLAVGCVIVCAARARRSAATASADSPEAPAVVVGHAALDVPCGQGRRVERRLVLPGSGNAGNGSRLAPARLLPQQAQRRDARTATRRPDRRDRGGAHDQLEASSTPPAAGSTGSRCTRPSAVCSRATGARSRRAPGRGLARRPAAPVRARRTLGGREPGALGRRLHHDARRSDRRPAGGDPLRRRGLRRADDRRARGAPRAELPARAPDRLAALELQRVRGRHERAAVGAARRVRRRPTRAGHPRRRGRPGHGPSGGARVRPPPAARTSARFRTSRRTGSSTPSRDPSLGIVGGAPGERIPVGGATAIVLPA